MQINYPMVIMGINYNANDLHKNALFINCYLPNGHQEDKLQCSVNLMLTKLQCLVYFENAQYLSLHKGHHEYNQ